MHLRHVINDYHHHKFLILSTDGWLFSYIHRETPTPPDENCLISTLPSLSVPFLTSCPPYMRVLTSFHGLLCVGISSISGSAYRDLILWNPTTGDYKILSKTNVVIGSFGGFGLYYDSCDDDYKLLHITESCDVYNYSLRFDSWRKLVGFESNSMRYSWLNPSLWLNENLYLLGGSSRAGTIMIRFDTVTEKITVMKLPAPCSGPAEFPHKFVCRRLFAHEGYINLCVGYEGNYIDVKYDTWRMMNGDWSMVDIYNMDEEVPLMARMLKIQHLMRNGEWLMIHRPYKDHFLYMFDPEKKAHTYTRLSTFRHILVEGRYTETLVSPNQYI